jgi:UPF0755 protein
MAKKKTIRILLLAAGVLLVGLGAAAGAYYAVYGGAVARGGSVYVRSGESRGEWIADLTAGGFLKNPARFERTARWLGFTGDPAPGHYRLTENTDYLQLIRAFQRGWQTPVRVTFNNIRTLPQLAGRIARQIEADSAALADRLTAPEAAERFGFTGETFIGMFVPNTYEMYWNVSPDAFLERMKTEYDRFWSDVREAKREKTGMSRNEVTTLASIVAEETVKADEMARVAGVYVNRLKTGMILQADPTLKFAVGDFTLRRILDVHKEVESPYNTYKYAGLPPGPICMPPVTAIDAVLDHEDHDYYYFCAKEDFSGYHRFARTLAEHNRNAERYHAALDNRGIR